MELTDADFEHGSLRLVSYARPTKLFTAHESLFVSEAGALCAAALQRITDEVVALMQGHA